MLFSFIFLSIISTTQLINFQTQLINCYLLKTFSVIGTIFIIAGLYTVVWGKGKDKRMTDDDKISKRLPVKSPVKPVVAGKGLAGEPEMKTKQGQETNKATELEI